MSMATRWRSLVAIGAVIGGIAIATYPIIVAPYMNPDPWSKSYDSACCVVTKWRAAEGEQRGPRQGEDSTRGYECVDRSVCKEMMQDMTSDCCNHHNGDIYCIYSVQSDKWTPTVPKEEWQGESSSTLPFLMVFC
ncbi:hypothetical protein BaRGS_00004921 [Batillaria attramentaria]|uniref:Uncharacterized protein n=1 Tax=Batillaria attramentaria TaxID=370345 RepID=A0ABD0LWM8_9CAEN